MIRKLLNWIKRQHDKRIIGEPIYFKGFASYD